MEALKQELSEELEKEEYKNPFEYNKDELIEVVDDTWVSVDDRSKLIDYLKSVIATEFPWADKNLVECFIKKKYYQTILTMDREQYENDKIDPISSTFNNF
tara:strand:- start:814 stop:1116 length:303 start_codon:yes stop_codon:yes gene_type:complete